MGSARHTPTDATRSYHEWTRRGGQTRRAAPRSLASAMALVIPPWQASPSAGQRLCQPSIGPSEATSPRMPITGLTHG